MEKESEGSGICVIELFVEMFKAIRSHLESETGIVKDEARSARNREKNSR